MNYEGVAALANVLPNMSMLRSLRLSENRHITTVGWGALFNTLQTHNSALEKLYLTGNNIDDEVVNTMVDAIANMRSLKKLYLSSNQLITPSGWGAISDLLNRPNSRLHTLYLQNNENSINDDVVTSFANSLVSNTSLKELHFSRNDAVTARGWAALSNVLCNKASLGSIYNSNHTLGMVMWKDNLPSDLVSCLRLNRNNDKAEVARQKILRYHFSCGESNIQDFVGMELEVLPRAMS